MAAFQLALEQGADAIELDVHLSKDGVPVVIHDETLGRTTTASGRVVDHTVEQIRQIDAGSRFNRRFAGERVSTLQEVVAWAKDAIYLFIELKMAPVRYLGLEEAVVTLLQDSGVLHQMEVFSFDHRCARRIQELCSDLLTGVCYVGSPLSHHCLAEEARAKVLHPQWGFVSSEVVQQVHKEGLRVIPWAVNDVNIAQELIRMGVDAIVTGEPARIRAVVDKVVH